MSAPESTLRRRFAAEVNRPDGEINLALAALLVAKEEYPQLAEEVYLGRLDLLAEETQDRLGGETAPLVVLQEVLHTLYHRRGFRGNREVYYDPRNSFLNDVLDRRLGIPITLGMVVLEVGWRLGLPLEGVNFPGHFLVRYQGEALELLVDPFEGGALRFRDQLQELLDRVYGGMVRLHDSFLRPARRQEILVRLLTNLKSLYLHTGDHRRALGAVERILILRPFSPPDLRDRGVILARLGRREEALGQLQVYLQVAPEAADARRIRTLVDRLKRKGASSEEKSVEG